MHFNISVVVYFCVSSQISQENRLNLAILQFVFRHKYLLNLPSYNLEKNHNVYGYKLYFKKNTNSLL